MLLALEGYPLSRIETQCSMYMRSCRKLTALWVLHLWVSHRPFTDNSWFVKTKLCCKLRAFRRSVLLCKHPHLILLFASTFPLLALSSPLPPGPSNHPSLTVLSQSPSLILSFPHLSRPSQSLLTFSSPLINPSLCKYRSRFKEKMLPALHPTSTNTWEVSATTILLDSWNRLSGPHPLYKNPQYPSHSLPYY